MEEKQEKKVYKINVGDTIVVERQDVDWKGKKLIFYKTPIYMGTEEKKQVYKKYLMFKKGTQIEDGSKIRIKEMFEVCRHKTNDKFTDEFGLFINDYDIVSGNVVKAVEEYKEDIETNDNGSDYIF